MRILKITLLIFILIQNLLLAINTRNEGYKILATTTVDVNEWDQGYRITNSRSDAVFVPTKTATEWASFYNHPPANVSVVPLIMLNKITNETAAYSLRKLSLDYVGYCIRVRRSSDNAEQDIGFLGLDLDTLSLRNFVGSGNGYVKIWYDQTGRGHDAVQNTTGYQPRIANAGKVDDINGKSAMYFGGVSGSYSWLVAPNHADFAFGSNNFIVSSVYQLKNTGNAGTLLSINGLSGVCLADFTIGFYYTQPGCYNIYAANSSGQYGTQFYNKNLTTAIGTNPVIFTFGRNTINNFKGFQNGSQVSALDDTVSGTMKNGTVGIYIGYEADQNGDSCCFKGYIAEMIFVKDSIDTYQNIIYQEQNTYYFPSPVQIGDSYQGGIVFYVDGTGYHGLIAATADAPGTRNWAAAASYCDTLVVNGYSDWYLPSLSELQSLLWPQRYVVGGFNLSQGPGRSYWSSTVPYVSAHYTVYFYGGNNGSNSDSETFNTRPIRSF